MRPWFDGYAVREDSFDEVFCADGSLRPAAARVVEALGQLDPGELRTRVDFLQRTYVDQGVTFDLGGRETPFPLDIVPRVVEPREWAVVEAGVVQRVMALERFLDDVYGEGRVFADGVVPRKVVTTSRHFHRAVHGIAPPNGVRVHVAGVDLIRDPQGIFRVLEDNVRVPSGVSYVMTNRRALSAALPEVAGLHRIRPVQEYPSRLRAALAACAPRGVADPTVVVLTPGVYNSAYFEHALLARMMGCELVEGRDLVCQNGYVSVRTTQGLRPVHVIYRRVDDEFLDPATFRSDSLLGVAGLMNAARRGNVTIANAVGNGVADDKLVYTYVPDLVRYYLGEEPLIAGVDTWRLEEDAHREEVLDRLGELVVKPVDGSGGKGIVIGPAASREQLDALRARIVDDPRGWIAQPVVQLSTVPTMIDGRLAPRHVDLRPFAVNDGSGVWVLPGGLTRVALPEGELIVNSSQGGGSKDTWVLADTHDLPQVAIPEAGIPDAVGLVVQRHEDLLTERPKSQQEQQQQAGVRPVCGEGSPC
jgi:uncharacterized circularly permuted ATP-grasp superfamily protein